MSHGSRATPVAWALAGAGLLVAVARRLRRRAAIGLPQEELERLARFDPLTGVGNRVVFRDRLEHALARAERNDQRLAVLFLDIDRFKDINDQFGHEVGDGVLSAVAARLSSISRRADTVARLGGDEFTILLEGLNDPAGATTVAQKILDVMEEPIRVAGRTLTVSCSIGVALSPDDGTTAGQLMQHADHAMYRAKSDGRRRYQFSTPALREANEARVRMVHDLRRAIDKQALRLLYQPQVDIVTGEIVAVEALVRWVLPDGREVPAAAFIEVAEETNLMQPLTEWVLDKAASDAAGWTTGDLEGARVAVNLSPSQFVRSDLATVTRASLDRAALPAHRLEFEVTEEALSTRPDAAAEQLHELASMGVRLSVDDFGTGHSSLQHLERFPLHALKIAEPLIGDPRSQVPLAIVELAARFGLTTVAEGVETKEQLQHLRRIGCDRAQGFFFTRPLPSTGLETWVTERIVSPGAVG
ncbi:MAG: EAL domain-containing protein [Nitriliruptorales bacterium]|nr:EAL domain-containing protein [Nitriliruptorales bacterium]